MTISPRPGSVWVNDDGMSFTIKSVTADAHDLHVVTIVPTVGAGPAVREAVEFDQLGWDEFVQTHGLREVEDPADIVHPAKRQG